MKKTAFLLVILLMHLVDVQAKIQINLSYATFYSPVNGPYIDVYLYLNGSEITYVQKEGSFIGEIEVDYTYSLMDSLKEHPALDKHFLIETPVYKDTAAVMPNFRVQHRIYLNSKSGHYKIAAEVKDIHDNQSKSVDWEFKIDFNDHELQFSEIEIYESAEPTNSEGMFVKNGYKIIPFTSDIIPESMTEFGFYAELYNAKKVLGKDSAFLIIYYLEDFEKGTMIEGYRGFSRKEASDINLVMGKFLVDNLPGGNYNIKIDVHDKGNVLVASKSIPFHKENPYIHKDSEDELVGSFVDRYTSVDSLGQHIAYLQPIAESLEWDFAQNQLVEKDLDMMKRYFLNFWQTRNKLDPEYEWIEYLKKVHLCNRKFHSPVRPGYLSDRGYRYLKYGKPNSIYESFDEALAYPHEVWYYSQVNNQKNKAIIFYNRSAVLNEYEVLHSTITGEIYNKDWNLMLHRVKPGVYDEENPTVGDYFGDNTHNLMNGY